MAAMLVSPILSYPFQKLLHSRPQSSHSVTVRGNKMTTSKEFLDVFLLSLTFQHCWHLLAILEWVGTCQRMALSRCYCQRCTFWTKSICLCLWVGFHFGLAFMCSVHSYAEIYLACVPAFAYHSSLETALHHHTRHQSKTLLVKHRSVLCCATASS